MFLMVVKMKVMMMESVVSHQSVISPLSVHGDGGDGVGDDGVVGDGSHGVGDGGSVGDGVGDCMVWVILVRMVVKMVIRMV